MRNPFTLFALSLLLLLSAGCDSTTPTLVPTLNVPPPTVHSPQSTTPGTASPIDRPPTLSPAPTATATLSISPTPTCSPTPSATATALPPAVTYGADGRHAFPVAGDLALMTWTHDHWDGGNAVDIEAARYLPGDSEVFNTFIQLPVVAVVSGTVTLADNPYGGLALLLDGDDGYIYYYGHLSEQWVDDGQMVGAGDWIGRIGNTGRWTQYIEPHLHFSIATHEADDWRWEPDVNAAEKILAWFALPWQDLDIPDYPFDQASGWPLDVPAQITRSFAERQAETPDLGSIDILPLVIGTDPLPVYATLGGEVNVNRATVLGLRVQVTNRPARTTIVYSFMQETTVADGDVVHKGDLVGYIDPVVGLNYMLFVNDVQTDPTPTLGDPP